jgi:hypothetical protein
MENQEQKQAELSIADLQNIKTLIDVAVRRGAFVAGELTSVGAVYDRLSTFLSSVTPPQQEAVAESPADTAPTE